MGEAYDRERKLLGLLHANEKTGVRIDVRALRRDIKAFEDTLQCIDQWIFKRVGNNETLLIPTRRQTARMSSAI